jgi:hypothetical protein
VPQSLLARLPAYPQPRAAARQLSSLGVSSYDEFWQRPDAPC